VERKISKAVLDQAQEEKRLDRGPTADSAKREHVILGGKNDNQNDRPRKRGCSGFRKMGSQLPEGFDTKQHRNEAKKTGGNIATKIENP